MQMRNFLVTISLLVIIILFISLQSLWEGCVYFGLSFGVVLCLYWTIILILQYYQDYYKYLEEDFKNYCVRLINSTNMTTEDVNSNKDQIMKLYKKYIRKDKIIDISKILFVISLAIVCIVGMITK